MPALARLAFIYGIMLTGLVQVVGSLGAVLHRDGKYALFAFLLGLTDCFFSACCFFKEKWIVHWLLSYALLMGATFLLQRGFRPSGGDLPIVSIGVAGLAILCYIARWVRTNQSERKIKFDKSRYESVWATIVDAQAESLHDLCQAVSDLPTSTKGELRQRLRMEHNCSGETQSRIPSPIVQKITSLDLLYAQGQGLYHILLDKVKTWAHVSGGKLPVDVGERQMKYIKWEAIRESSALINSVKWPRLKAPDRAVEKASRCYSGDVSKLLDVCRSMLVFDSIADLKTCMNVIALDQDIALVRVKNRLDPNHQSSETAGFRNCLLNFRVTITPAPTIALKP
mmetsp:Transcript_6457/g.10211  ORF Transcript_6457/g.10211 Transcript_6457/m.10211 type:complete len:340 (-) Transcript_6457:761-1780(-)